MEINKIEEWRSIEDWPYEVNNFGIIRRAVKTARWGNFHVLKPWRDKHGYLYVVLGDKPRMKRMGVHGIVCAAFHGPRPSAMHDASHRDGSRDNNIPENVRWLTKQQNSAERRIHGTQPLGSNHSNAKITELMAKEIRFLHSMKIANTKAKCGARTSIAKRFGISANTVNNIVSRRQWKHV